MLFLKLFHHLVETYECNTVTGCPLRHFFCQRGGNRRVEIWRNGWCIPQIHRKGNFSLRPKPRWSEEVPAQCSRSNTISGAKVEIWSSSRGSSGKVCIFFLFIGNWRRLANIVTCYWLVQPGGLLMIKSPPSKNLCYQLCLGHKKHHECLWGETVWRIVPLEWFWVSLIPMTAFYFFLPCFLPSDLVEWCLVCSRCPLANSQVTSMTATCKLFFWFQAARRKSIRSLTLCVTSFLAITHSQPWKILLV